MKADFSTRPGTRQSGYALILMVLALMGIGGVVIAGFTQGVKQESEHERYLHNQRVLMEAKQALLQYAYNYPQMGPDQDDGPGRLPCADTDNDGLENYIANCSTTRLGRFPWRDAALNFYDARDASGERLWYAVSKNFGRGANSIVNSDRAGTITIRDRSGAILYDGTINNLHQYGIAAVIIAPGPAIERADGVVQDRAADENESTYYLDLFGAWDNAEFVNSDLNGFVTGPINDVVTGEQLVNDQMILVTAAEVVAMAEEATLQAYREAIRDYLAQTGGVYPWLFNYEGVDFNSGAGENINVAIKKLSTYYPADANFFSNPNYHDDTGRIPSIFGQYFARADSARIENEIKVTLTSDFAAIPGSVSIDGGGVMDFDTNPVFGSEHELELISDFLPIAFSGDAVDPRARLSVFLPAEDTITYTLYFWEVHAPGGSGDGGSPLVWKLCPDDGDGVSELEDCARNSNGTSNSGGNNHYDQRILRVEIEIVIGKDSGSDKVVDFDVDFQSDATISRVSAQAGAHATITADNIDFDKLDLTSSLAPTITVSYDIDHHYHEDENTFNSGYSGTLSAADFLAGAKLAVETRFFPEIPKWAYDNGWHNSIRMAYAPDYRPGVGGACNVSPDDDCMKINDLSGGPRDKKSLLIIAGEHDWDDADGDESLNSQDDLRTVFDEGNQNSNTTYYTHRGNDRVLVIEQL